MTSKVRKATFVPSRRAEYGVEDQGGRDESEIHCTHLYGYVGKLLTLQMKVGYEGAASLCMEDKVH